MDTRAIDLDAANATENERLNISLIWYGVSVNSDSLLATEARPIQLPLGTYALRHTGWEHGVHDSFFLVKRINEPDIADNLSPSNFKGSAGVSFLWSYATTGIDRTISVGALNSIEPSLGLNISYLDFDTSKDLELGVGVVIGLFRNLFFVTYGRNLNVKVDPRYFSIGFSFTDLSAKISSMTQNK
jgi:hypothetical protein